MFIPLFYNISFIYTNQKLKNMRSQLEKKIIGKISAIKNGTITPKESGIGKLLGMLKSVDEVAYENLIKTYKNIAQKEE